MLITYYYCLNQYKGKQWKLYSNSAVPQWFHVSGLMIQMVCISASFNHSPTPQHCKPGETLLYSESTERLLSFCLPYMCIGKESPFFFSEQALNKGLRHEIWSLSEAISQIWALPASQVLLAVLLPHQGQC